ncbi:MAG: hypothetical protein HYX94_00005 [Chloroflexi bacterium]|nr:hypothetical protein [Chloroflexota bacterium]
MDLQQLKSHLDNLADSLGAEDKRVLAARLQSLASVFPFNEYEYMLTFLVDRRLIQFDDYEKLRSNYVGQNRFLDLFGLAPRIFGQVWGEAHLRDLDIRFKKPSRLLDPSYEGQYDLFFEGICVEVKAARAINTKRRGDLASKALRFGTSEPFWMNFQQLKLDVCNVFVFIGVWVDRIQYWVLSNEEIKANRYLSHQHRGGIEYQIGITNRNIAEFREYETDASRLAETALAKVADSEGAH